MFLCELCNFSHDNRQNFIQHCKSKIHIGKEELKNICVVCDKIFRTHSSYKTHKYNYHNDNKKTIKKTINNKNIVKNKNNVEEIKGEIQNSKHEIKKQINRTKKEVKDEVKKTKEEVKTIVANAITKASTLIKYLMQNHNSVPPIKRITDKECIEKLRFDVDCPLVKNNIYMLERTLIHQYANGYLVDTLYKTILSLLNHKKPNLQPIYNTDASRHNYVIKTTKEWNEDMAGVKFTDYIIKPLLSNISKLIGEYREKELDTVNMRKNTFAENEDHVNHLNDTVKLECDLYHERLIKPILKKLSPHLRYLQSEIEELETFNQIEDFQQELENLIKHSSDNELDYDPGIGDSDLDSVVPVKNIKKHKRISYSESDSECV